MRKINERCKRARAMGELIFAALRFSPASRAANPITTERRLPYNHHTIYIASRNSHISRQIQHASEFTPFSGNTIATRDSTAVFSFAPS